MISRRKKIVALNLMAALAILAAAEIILRVSDSGIDAASLTHDSERNPDLQVQFDRIFHPETVDGRVMMTTRLVSKYEATGITDLTKRFLVFPAEKAKGKTRIFVLGSSPVWGTYDEDPARNTLFTWHLERQLQKRLGPGADKFEIINAAHVGFGGPEVIRSLDEILNYQPDIIVVYNGGVMPLVAEGLDRRDLTSSSELLGFNKVLHSLRLFHLVSMIFEKSPEDRGMPAQGKVVGEILPMGDSPRGQTPVPIELDQDGIPNFSPGSGRLVQPEIFHQETVNLVKNLIRITQDDYRKTYRRTFKPAADSHVNVIACTVATNIAGIPPYWSMHWEPLSGEKLKEFAALYNAGREWYTAGDFAAAREKFEAAVEISPTFADAQYLLAEILKHDGEMGKAKEHYHLAKEYDASNERALDRPNAILREVAAKYGARVVDSEAVLAVLNPNGIIGNELFIDHQHPKGFGLAALAEAVADPILELASDSF